MNEETKRHLKKYCESKGWETTDKSLIELIIDSGENVWEGKRDRHRWYTLIPTVVKVAGIFIKYNYCDPDGEMSDVNDCIGGYKLEDMEQVFPKEVKTTIYEPKN